MKNDDISSLLDAVESATTINWKNIVGAMGLTGFALSMAIISVWLSRSEDFKPSGTKFRNYAIIGPYLYSDSLYRPSDSTRWYMKDFDNDGSPDIKVIVDAKAGDDLNRRIYIKRGYEKAAGIQIVDADSLM